MTTPFTARQGQYLSFIHGFIVRRGVAPSFEEIGAHFGTTPPSVNNMIKTLDQRGLISRVRGAARTLRVLVPVAELPGSDFGSGTSWSKPSRGDSGAGERTVSAVDGATVAAIAVLDAVMPHVIAGAGVDPASVVLEAARALCDSLSRLGVSGTGPAEVARRVAADLS